MYQRYSTKEQRFNKRFPLSIVAILAVAQMLTSFAIVALEIGHNLLHMQLTNLFAGFWTAIPFTILWISMFAVGKNRSSRALPRLVSVQCAAADRRAVRHTQWYKTFWRSSSPAFSLPSISCSSGSPTNVSSPKASVISSRGSVHCRTPSNVSSTDLTVAVETLESF